MSNLILTRRLGESVIATLGEQLLSITLLDIQEYQVRLSFKASREVTIHREEIYERILTEKRQHGDLI